MSENRAAAWIRGLAAYRDPRLLVLVGLGFSSGLPILLVFGTLSYWLRSVGLSLTVISLFAFAKTPYTLKFLGAPLIDRGRIPLLGARLGQRRSWILVTQLALALALAGMSVTDPTAQVKQLAILAIGVAALSASQDVAIDAFRIESLAPEEQGAGAAAAVLGYRLGMLAAGAGALLLSDAVGGWANTYRLLAVAMGLCALVTLLAKEPSAPARRAGRTLVRLLRESVLAPFSDFARRPGWAMLLVFMILFKAGDALAGALRGPFLLDIGFQNVEIAAIDKLYGVLATLAGAALGGALVRSHGLTGSLWVAGVLQMISNLAFVGQSIAGHNLLALTGTIGIENFAGGVGTAAFVAWLSVLCSREYTATQYALFTSFAAIAQTWLSGPAGLVADAAGWNLFFVLSTVAAAPGLLLLLWLQRRRWVEPLPHPVSGEPS